MGRTVRRQIVRGRNLVGTNCKGRIIGGRSVRGQTVGVPGILIDYAGKSITMVVDTYDYG